MSTGQQAKRQKTKRIALETPPPLMPPIVWLMAYPRGGLARHPLHRGKTVVVGREAIGHTDLSLDEPSLSLQHAKFVLTDKGIDVEDTGSTNGTFVGGARIFGRATVQLGETLLLGAVRVVIHGEESASPRPQTISGLMFRAALEDEITRCREFHRSCTLMMVRRGGTASEDEAHVSKFVPAVLERMRATDKLTRFNDKMLALLFPEMTREKAAELAAKLSDPKVGLDARFAVFPEGGHSVDELEESCRLAFEGERHGAETNLGKGKGIQTSRVEHDAVIAESDVMRALLAQARKRASSKRCIVLLGETGTGKTMIAKWIHDHSDRAKGPFKSRNCGAFADQLAVTDFFGVDKGAYTNAVPRPGLFEQAHGGTLFLDEIGDLSQAIQTALLTAVEGGKFQRVGGTKDIIVDVRLIVATNKNLEKLVRAGDFREDLFHRLDAVQLVLPPLRERTEDIPPLALKFVREFWGKRSGVGAPPPISDAAMALLTGFSWPGNIRQLRNVVGNAMDASDGREIGPTDLREEVMLGNRAASAVASAPLELAVPIVDYARISKRYDEACDEFERGFLLHWLAEVGGVKKKLAELIGMSERTLRKHWERLFGR